MKWYAAVYVLACWLTLTSRPSGDVLREAVLDAIEDDDQLKKLRSDRQAKDMEEFYATLPSDVVHEVRQATDRLLGEFCKLKEWAPLPKV